MDNIPEKECVVVHESETYSSVNPIISVIVTDYVRHKYLKETVKSVIEQDLQFDKMELIILTDSMDIDFRFIPKKYAHAVYYTGLIPIGEAYVLGFQKSRGGIICPVDNDDLFRHDKLSKILTCFKEDENLILIKDEITPIGRNANFLTRLMFLLKMNIGVSSTSRLYVIDEKVNRRILGKALTHNVSSMSFRKKIFSSKEELKNLSKVVSLSDPYIFYHACLHKGRIGYLDEFLTYYRIDENLGSSDFIQNYGSRSKVRYQFNFMNDLYLTKIQNLSDKTFFNLYRIFTIVVLAELNLKGHETNTISMKDLAFLFRYSIKYRAFNYFLLLLAYYADHLKKLYKRNRRRER